MEPCTIKVSQGCGIQWQLPEEIDSNLRDKEIDSNLRDCENHLKAL
jgi:hypothetical protein